MISIIHPLIPSKHTEIRNITLGAKCCCVRRKTVALEEWTWDSIAYESTSLDGIILENHGGIGGTQILSDSFFQQADIKFSTVGPGGAFL